MTYGSDVADAFCEAGIYVGRILKGAKPAELPVVESIRSSWSSTTRPPGCSALQCRTTLLSPADEVIE